MLRFPYRARPRKMSRQRLPEEGIIVGPEGRLQRLRQLVTGLVRYERIETVHQHCDETRGYAERLIHTAIRYGDQHQHTMEMADYWLNDKDLIYKLFDVLVPRYQNYSSAFTNIYRTPIVYPGRGTEMGILELKGNPWPDVLPKQRDNRYIISNVLLHAAKKDYNISKESKKTNNECNSSSENNET
ncbi:39S ribosomal protein L17, mitochondrial [Patella vulgata]|uniref:39S ribosomal protein L17, mitochondrial n=1 Tax=Patella vulgata TaxID=6465 RepID=UPI00217FE47E|nr:39S ribosomal protein L17, mitochondrial [Patella vulgata]